jgi:hypothetical protein
LAQGLSRVAVSAIACGAFIVLLSFGIRSSFAPPFELRRDRYWRSRSMPSALRKAP